MTELDLSGFALTEFPVKPVKWNEYLKNSDIDPDAHQYIKKMIKNMRKIEKLDISENNDLKELPDKLTGLIELNCCSSSCFEKLPNKMDKLKWLDVSFTNVKSIPYNLKCLSFLDINGSGRIDDLHENLYNLERLYCSETNLRQLPNNFKKLKYLECDSCPNLKVPIIDSLKHLDSSDSPEFEKLGIDDIQSYRIFLKAYYKKTLNLLLNQNSKGRELNDDVIRIINSYL
jgi:hypothetical protein